jgi:hypothetical protein
VEALADAEGLALMLLPIVRPLPVALGVAPADAEGLAIMLPSIICVSFIIRPLGIMCSPFICWAVAPGASTSIATRASAAMYTNRLMNSSVSSFRTPEAQH